MRNLVLKSFLSCWKAFLNAGLAEEEDSGAVRFVRGLGSGQRAGKGHVPKSSGSRLQRPVVSSRPAVAGLGHALWRTGAASI